MVRFSRVHFCFREGRHSRKSWGNTLIGDGGRESLKIELQLSNQMTPKVKELRGGVGSIRLSQ
jgi:hypothetical protein